MSTWAERRQREFVEMLALTEGLTFTSIASGLAGTDLVRAFRHHFEAAAFASFAVGEVPAGLWRRMRSFGDGFAGILDPYFERLLTSNALRDMFPDLAIAAVDQQITPNGGGYRVVDPLLLEGHLAMALRNGGAHSRLPAHEALRLAADFRTRLCGDRYSDILVLAGSSWSDWFHMVTGDYAWLITDTATSEAHLLCASGTD